MAWLTEHRHEEIVRLLGQQSATAISIKSLLSQDRTALWRRLDAFDRMLASIASAVDELKPVAIAMRPGSQLSAQALDLLRQFHHSGASKIMDCPSLQTRQLLVVGGQNNGTFAIADLRFLDDDLKTLVTTGLLHLEHQTGTRHIYTYTRRAAELIEYVERSRQFPAS